MSRCCCCSLSSTSSSHRRCGGSIGSRSAGASASAFTSGAHSANGESWRLDQRHPVKLKQSSTRRRRSLLANERLGSEGLKLDQACRVERRLPKLSVWVQRPVTVASVRRPAWAWSWSLNSDWYHGAITPRWRNSPLDVELWARNGSVVHVQ